MTPRERLIAALNRRPLTGRVPHFELVFYLTMEKYGRVHPGHRHYGQWFQMSDKERQLHREDMADLHIRVAQDYEHSAIFLHPNPGNLEEAKRLVEIVRQRTNDTYFLMLHGDATFGIPNGDRMSEFVYRLVDEPQKVKEEAAQAVRRALDRAEDLATHGMLDGFALCSDYCFNSGPFLSPDQFSEFVTPYLAELTTGYRDLGFYVIKHTDGNILPILDQLVATEPHALHSIDPQAGMDMATIKQLVGDDVCLIGNVNCGLMQTGTEEQVVASVRAALQGGMPGGGFIFSTSNCVYTGMDLNRYDLMLDVWRREGNYPGSDCQG